MSLPERTSQHRCDLRPDAIQLQIMLPEITARLFVPPCNTPLTLRRTAKVLSGRKDLLKTPKRIAQQSHFPYPTERRSTTGLKYLELRLGGFESRQAHSAPPSIFLRAIRPHSRSQSLMCSLRFIRCELDHEQQQQANGTNGDVPNDTGNLVRPSTEGACTTNDLSWTHANSGRWSSREHQFLLLQVRR